MSFVVVEEPIPESHARGSDDLSALRLIAGFAVMTTLDVTLG